MSVETKQVMEAVEQLREKLEKYGEASVEYKSAMEKTNEILEKQEEKSQQIVADMAAERKAAEELKEKVESLELELARKSTSDNANYKESMEYKALEKFAIYGEKGLDADELKTLRMDNDTQGGYLATTEMDNTLIKKVTEISPVRQVARVKTVSKKTLEIARRESIPVATYEGEAAAGNDDNSTYGSEQLTTYRLTVTVPFTMDLLNDSAFDLESEINADVAEAFAFGEGNKFVLGTGAKQPEGFLVNADIAGSPRMTASAGTISGDDLLLLTGDLKAGYNPLFGFNRQTLAFLRTLKGSDGHYLWQAGLAPNQPNTIAGEPYIVMQDMPSIAANNLAVIYGDFTRGYTITDRTGMVIVRDEYSRKREAIVEMTFHRWNTGQVVLPEAFKALKISA